MTTADRAHARGMSLSPSQGGRPHPVETPHRLPDGWRHFFSRSDPEWGIQGRWYAVPPWADEAQLGKHSFFLTCTVYADTWAELCDKVVQQIDIYEKVTNP